MLFVGASNSPQVHIRLVRADPRLAQQVQSQDQAVTENPPYTGA